MAITYQVVDLPPQASELARVQVRAQRDGGPLGPPAIVAVDLASEAHRPEWQRAWIVANARAYAVRKGEARAKAALGPP